jgi:hypothetical protein
LRSTSTSVEVPVRGGDGAGDHGLAGPGRGDQDTEVMAGQFVRGRVLLAGKGGCEGECLLSAGGSRVGDLHPAASLLGQ